MKRRWGISVGVLVILLGWWGGCISRRPTLEERLGGRAMPELGATTWNGRQIGYAATGPKDKPLIVFVHGTPGSWQAFFDYLIDPRLGDQFRLVAIDRPGWGRSGLGSLEVSLAAQAEAVITVIEAQQSAQPVFVVGHSLGGTIAAQIALDRPDLIAGTVIISASLNPEIERPTWYQSVGRWRIVQWAVPDQLDWANQELKSLPEAFGKMTPRWLRMAGAVAVIHGEKDGLVPVAHAGYVAKMATNAEVETVILPSEGHFALWSNRDTMVREILALVARSQRANRSRGKKAQSN